MGRHLFLLGVLLLIVIALGFVTAGIVAVYTVRQGHPWWVAAGASSIILAGVAAALRPVAAILGPEGITGIIKQRNNSPVNRVAGCATGNELPPSSAS